MPFYRVWYRDNAEPLEFSTAWRCSEAEIVDRIVVQEHLRQGEPAAPTSAVQELIARHHLSPVRYTEDESEMNTIG